MTSNVNVNKCEAGTNNYNTSVPDCLAFGGCNSTTPTYLSTTELLSTPTQYCVVSFTDDPSRPCIVYLRIIQGAGVDAKKITWPANVKLCSTANRISTGDGWVDYARLYFDGTTYWGYISEHFS